MARVSLLFLAASALALAGCASAQTEPEGYAAAPPAPGGPCCAGGVYVERGAVADREYAPPPAPAYAPPPPQAPCCEGGVVRRGYVEHGSDAESYDRTALAGGYTEAQTRYSGGAMAAQAYGEQRGYASTTVVEDSRSSLAHHYEAAWSERQRTGGRVHHTTDAAGYLSWAGKTTDYVDDGGQAGYEQAGYVQSGYAQSTYAQSAHVESGYVDEGGAYAGAAPCPPQGGVRVLSCQFIPFKAPPEETAVQVDDEDFAYEGGVGPVSMSGGGGGGGGGETIMTSGTGFANASSSASAQASASASASISINEHGGHGFHDHGGGYGGHGGDHGGGYGGGGGGGMSGHGGGYGGGGQGGGGMSGWGGSGGGHSGGYGGGGYGGGGYGGHGGGHGGGQGGGMSGGRNCVGGGHKR